MAVVDASIVVRLLQNRGGDAPLRDWFAQHRHVHAPALIDAEVASAARGLLSSEVPAKITSARAAQLLDDFAGLSLVRYPLQPHHRRVLALCDNFTAYDAFYIALAESLDMPLFTDDRKYAKAPGHTAVIHTWP